MRKLLKRLFVDRLDLALIALAVLAFSGFIEGTVLDRAGQIGGPVGRLISNYLQRKRVGMVEFQSIGPGADLFSNDLVWTGESEEARVRLDDGSTLRIPGGTLLVLRHFSNGDWDQSIEVLRGEALLESRHEEKKISSIVQLSDVMAPTSTPAPVPDTQRKMGIYPSPGMIFISISPHKQLPIVFSWNDPLDGELTLALQGQSRVLLRTPVKSTSSSLSIQAPSQPGVYEWRVSGSGKTLGPYSFEIRPYDLAQIREIIQKKPHQLIEFVP